MRELGGCEVFNVTVAEIVGRHLAIWPLNFGIYLTALQAGILKSLKAGSRHAACKFIVALLAHAHATLQIIPARVAVQWFQQRFKLHESKDDTTIGCGFVQP